MIFADDYHKLAESNLEYKCVCSEDRFISGIQLLGMDEIIDIKKDVTSYTGEDDLLPCLDETQKNIEEKNAEKKENEAIPQDTKNKN